MGDIAKYTGISLGRYRQSNTWISQGGYPQEYRDISREILSEIQEYLIGDIAKNTGYLKGYIAKNKVAFNGR